MALAALRGTVRLESCLPPFLARGRVVVRLRGWGGEGGLRRRGGRRWVVRSWGLKGGRERVGMSAVGSLARIAGLELWLRQGELSLSRVRATLGFFGTVVQCSCCLLLFCCLNSY